jgi:RNA-splicing ligase RtcB
VAFRLQPLVTRRAEHVYRSSDRAALFLPPGTVEAEALEQIKNTASMPFVYKHVAVMPDCHCGKGATVGTVIARKPRSFRPPAV